MSWKKNRTHIDLRPSPKICFVYPTPSEVRKWKDWQFSYPSRLVELRSTLWGESFSLIKNHYKQWFTQMMYWYFRYFVSFFFRNMYIQYHYLILVSFFSAAKRHDSSARKNFGIIHLKVHSRNATELKRVQWLHAAPNSSRSGLQMWRYLHFSAN